jgi:hypothetical protein
MTNAGEGRRSGNTETQTDQYWHFALHALTPGEYTFSVSEEQQSASVQQSLRRYLSLAKKEGCNTTRYRAATAVSCWPHDPSPSSASHTSNHEGATKCNFRGVRDHLGFRAVACLLRTNDVHGVSRDSNCPCSTLLKNRVLRGPTGSHAYPAPFFFGTQRTIVRADSGTAVRS